jgi:hypothetical protein
MNFDLRRYLDGTMGGLFAGLGIALGVLVVVLVVLGCVQLGQMIGAV